VLRPYQQQAIAAVKQHWLAGRRAVVLVMPVGGGKTRVAEHLMVNVLDKSWAQIFFVAHTEQLIDQPAQRFQDRRIAHAFVKAGRKADATAQVQFCSDATMVRRDVDVAVGADGKPYTRAVVIVDEAHRVRSATYLQILTKLSRKFQFVYLLLLTGTPYRLDGRGLADVASALVEAATPRQLMGLAPFADGGTLRRPVILPPRYIAQPRPDDVADNLRLRQQRLGIAVADGFRDVARRQDDGTFQRAAVGEGGKTHELTRRRRLDQC
jgi:superfamily II DNA or RNA helicase